MLVINYSVDNKNQLINIINVNNVLSTIVSMTRNRPLLSTLPTALDSLRTYRITCSQCYSIHPGQQTDLIRWTFCAFRNAEQAKIVRRIGMHQNSMFQLSAHSDVEHTNKSVFQVRLEHTESSSALIKRAIKSTLFIYQAINWTLEFQEFLALPW